MDLNIEDVNKCKFTFGKYNGQTFEEVYKLNKSYFPFLLSLENKKHFDENKIKFMINYYKIESKINDDLQYCTICLSQFEISKIFILNVMKNNKKFKIIICDVCYDKYKHANDHQLIRKI